LLKIVFLESSHELSGLTLPQDFSCCTWIQGKHTAYPTEDRLEVLGASKMNIQKESTKLLLYSLIEQRTSCSTLYFIWETSKHSIM